MSVAERGLNFGVGGGIGRQRTQALTCSLEPAWTPFPSVGHGKLVDGGRNAG